MKEKDKLTIFKYLMIPLSIALIGFFFWHSVYIASQGTFTIKADDNIVSSLENLNRSITINNYYEELSCIDGCRMAFDEIASDKSVISIDGFSKSQCKELCLS